MAIGALFEGPGVTQQQYDAVFKEVIPDGKPPLGMVSHIAGPIEGGWRVVDVWESEQTFKTFGDKLIPAMQRAGFAPIEPKVWPIHNSLAR